MKTLGNSLLCMLVIIWLVAYAAGADSTVADAQARLKQLGYDPGPADGIWGARTQKAIEGFQQKSGLTMSGQLDTETKQKLGIAKPPPAASTFKPSAPFAKEPQAVPMPSVKPPSAGSREPVQISDDTFFFKISIPGSWLVVKEAKDADSAKRLIAASPDGNQLIEVFAFHANGTVDMNKLVENGEKVFGDLGREVDRLGFFGRLMDTMFHGGVNKVYFSEVKKRYCRARYTSKGSFGYILLATSPNNSIDEESIFFKTFAPMSQTWAVRIRETLDNVKPAIFGIAAIFVLTVIGGCGFLLRDSPKLRFLYFVMPACITVALLFSELKWYTAVGAGAVIFVLMGLGGIGVLIVPDSD